ncbi:Ig-like domain-containing domain [Cyclobacterium sp. 1_MG-2023]|uniref:Ig-like domain-containing domain n=1 Tax=Cyclobacterium sp. 1_MG-2023 TaxID=3062681 RepID=UPI0026E2C586|nr:Ig-like domain-containing domain [Cyclobacterium sp. 1_MG-2023]MDO6438084.1 Ig-like domain-containing domain [Cyclobacterium sp. 1_MG-2023]
MKKLFNISYLILIATLLAACAKQSSPMGGPKDEDSPILLSSDPKNESINIKPEKIDLEFNEYVELENPTQSIIITPKIDKDKVEYTALKEHVLIDLNQELEDSTTYVFNFQKSIQDITEGNPAEQLKLVFSTGETIDSLSVSGQVDYWFSEDKPDYKDILVGLYINEDSTDLFTSAPYYIAQVDTAGKYKITNIKAGTFRAYAWYDENNSLKAEHRSEPYGFLSEPLEVNENIENLQINLNRADLSTLKINRTSSTSGKFDVILSKDLANYNVFHQDKNTKLFFRKKDNNIRFYHTELINDSTEVRLQLMDSVGVQIDSTFYARFEESDRSKEKLEISTLGETQFIDTINAKLSFNKPIFNINYDSLYIAYDTASTIILNPDMVSFADSSGSRTLLNLTIPINDSIPYEKYKLIAADSTFQDVEMLWNEEEFEATYSRLKKDNLGDEISGKVLTDERPIIIQLLDKSNNIIREKYLTETNQFSFTKLEATNYKLRAIIDRNKNKAWDPGNINFKIQPEPVYFYYDEESRSKELILRGGWTLQDQILTKRRETGLLINNKALETYEIDEIPLSILEITEDDLLTN